MCGEREDNVEKEEDKERDKEIVPVKMKTTCSSSRSTGQWMATKFVSNLGVIFYLTISEVGSGLIGNLKGKEDKGTSFGETT